MRDPEYGAAFTDVAGLGEGDEVRYAGIEVGRVWRVAIDPANPARLQVTFRVREGTPVRTNTRDVAGAAGDEALRGRYRLPETFGRGESCGRPIAAGRSDPLPYARQCIECKQRQQTATGADARP